MKSAKMIDCPFCGHWGPKSKEHVWAEWMRDTPGARLLLAESYGRRIDIARGGYVRDQSGRYREWQDQPKKTAELLPHVSVEVCDSCNSGWMSRLENGAKRVFAPLRQVGWPIMLGADEQQLLATWVTKSWMAYALLGEDLSNPFSVDDYGSMAAEPAPLKRSRIWLLHSHASTAHVGMGVSGTLSTFGDTVPDMATTQNNSGFGYMAVDGAVLFMVLAPEDRLQMLDVLDPGLASEENVVQIWPVQERFLFPQQSTRNELMSILISWPTKYSELMGLPVEGLTHDDVEQAYQEFSAGSDPGALREKWAR